MLLTVRKRIYFDTFAIILVDTNEAENKTGKETSRYKVILPHSTYLILSPFDCLIFIWYLSIDMTFKC